MAIRNPYRRQRKLTLVQKPTDPTCRENTEISRRGAAGQFETSTVVEAPNSSGAMRPF